jgi:hypothetical protein
LITILVDLPRSKRRFAQFDNGFKKVFKLTPDPTKASNHNNSPRKEERKNSQNEIPFFFIPRHCGIVR